MALRLNHTTVAGNLTRDPECRFIQGDRKVCNISVAHNRKFRVDGELREEVSFFDVTCYGRIAENVEKYLQKGAPVVVVGRLKQERWQDRDGGGNRSKVVIIAEDVQFVPTGQRQGGQSTAAQPGESSHEYADRVHGPEHAQPAGQTTIDDEPPF